MANDFRGKNLLTLLDYTNEEINDILAFAKTLKTEKKEGKKIQPLTGKNIALLFEKDSTRTRCAFEVGAYDLGMNVTYLGPTGSQMGKKETIKDTARVLGRMFDGIEYRGFSQKTVETLGEYSGVPVWNGLTDKYHPTQILADFLTIIEHKQTLKGIKIAYYGDARNNMGNSLMIGAAITGMNFVAVAPKSLWPDEPLIERCEAIAKKSGGSIDLTNDPHKGAQDADVVYTDVWVSMGEPEQVWDMRIQSLLPYQVNKTVMERAKKDAIFMHCLPSFHNAETTIGKKIQDKYGLCGLEVTEDVFESSQSVVFEEAENRLHTIKSVMAATMGAHL